MEYRGVVTGMNYVWNPRHLSRWVDKRDLPGLIEKAGLENLTGGEGFMKFRAKKLAPKKPRKSRRKAAEAAAPEPKAGGEVETEVISFIREKHSDQEEKHGGEA